MAKVTIAGAEYEADTKDGSVLESRADEYMKAIYGGTDMKNTDEIEDMLECDAWYCGHFHGNKKIDKLRFRYDDIAVVAEF